MTRPEEWTPSAVYQATRLFASNLNQRMAQRFYNILLLPRVREDIQEHKRLNFWLYMALKKALYKSAAFYKGILLPLCEVRQRFLLPLPACLPSLTLPLPAARAATARCARRRSSAAF